MDVSQDTHLLDCPTYEDYLDTFITRDDLKYIRNIRFGRMLVELGYRSATEIYTPEQFEQRKAAALEAMFPTKKSLILFSDKMQSKDPVLRQLATREKANYQKIISTIIFSSHKLRSGFEVSGYIDFEHSLKKTNMKAEDATDWKSVFAERKSFKPKPTDLSYYHWRSGVVSQNDTDNYVVLNDPAHGLMFMHKGDRKLICVDPAQERYSENVARTMVHSDRYGYVIFYDHVIRKKI